jgi:hypothetical protein
MFLGLGQGARAGDGAKLAAGDRARLEEAFGATIVSTYPDGRQAELWLKRDGAYLSEGRRHDRSSGTWQIKDDKLCLRQHAPFPAPFSFCTAVPSGSLDKPWQSKAFTGETITVRLVKGMHTGGGGDLKQAGASAQSATRGTE